MARRQQVEESQDEETLIKKKNQKVKLAPNDNVGLSDTFLADSDASVTLVLERFSKDKPIPGDDETDLMGRKQLIINQKKDPDFIPLISSALPPEEAAKVGECLYLKDDVLVRKWRPPDAPLDQEWQVVYQIVVPKIYRRDIMSLAHDTPMSGHLGINKTYLKILNHFYWPKMKKSTVSHAMSFKW